MSKFGRPSPEEVREAIRSYLHNHPEIDGVKGLSESTGISYHSLQKYAKGSNTPPRDKWEILARVIEYSALGPESTKPGLFFSRLDDQKMASKNPDNNNNSPENSALEAAEPTQPSAKVAASESHKINGSPELFSDLTTDDDNWSHAKDRQEIFLPVSGFTWFYPEEVEIIDHPAFQRLSGIHQLGMTHLVYRGATHRRIEHSLGAVGIAQRMLEAATHNCRKRNDTFPDSKDRWLLGLPPTKFERRFIRLGALLHDIGHVAYGHTIEDELRLLNKHDDDERVDKIFNGTTWHNSEVKSLGETIDEQYRRFMPKALTTYQPSDILKRIVLKPPKDATDEQKSEDKVFQNQCAAAGLRISICRDIVGNTICADLLDYLHRDWYHLGKPRYFDERILHYMEIRTPESNKPISQDKYPDPTAEDVFVISIGNLPKLRTDGISAILSLLESRYELAEAVLFHRTKMNATAMLERALSFCIPQSKIAKSRGKAGKAKSVGGTNPLTEDEEKENRRSILERWLIDNPEEALLPALLNGTGPVKETDVTGVMKSDWERGQKLVSRLLRRDLYEPFMIVAYDEFEGRDVHSIQAMYGDDENAPANRAKALRLLEEDFDLPPGSIVMYCPESRMNKKIAEFSCL